jgi:hypothetical protein
MNGKGCGRKLRCSIGICLEELRKATKTEGLLASKMQIDRVTTAPQKTKGLLVSQIQVHNIATTPHKP